MGVSCSTTCCRSRAESDAVALAKDGAHVTSEWFDKDDRAACEENVRATSSSIKLQTASPVKNGSSAQESDLRSTAATETSSQPGAIDQSALGAECAESDEAAACPSGDEAVSPGKAVASSAGALGTDFSDEHSKMLQDVERLVTAEYDILEARRILRKLESMMGTDSEAWKNVLQLPAFKSYQRRLSYYSEVGHGISENTEKWFCAYKDSTGTQTIHGQLEPGNKYGLQYRVSVQIPAKLTNVMAVGNEVQLLPTWNKLVVNIPQVLGRRTAHHMVLNYQMRALAGMYQIDMLNEIKRYSSVDGGFLVEYIRSCDQEHQNYKAPPKGYNRPETMIKNIWIACGSDMTILIQTGRLVLPFAVSKWVASTVGGLAGSFILDGLVKNSLRSIEQGNPWQPLMEEDQSGLYRRLEECADSEASRSRAQRKVNAKDVSLLHELRPFFECEHVHEGSY